MKKDLNLTDSDFLKSHFGDFTEPFFICGDIHWRTFTEEAEDTEYEVISSELHISNEDSIEQSGLATKQKFYPL